MDRRREVQRAYNLEHGITPTTIRKSVDEIRFTTRVADAREDPVPRTEPLSAVAKAGVSWAEATAAERDTILKGLEDEMRRAADDLDFELAAQIRDQLMDLRASGGPGGRGTGGPKPGPAGPAIATKRRRRGR